MEAGGSSELPEPTDSLLVSASPSWRHCGSELIRAPKGPAMEGIHSIQDGKLCNRCSEIDFPRVYAHADTYFSGFVVDDKIQLNGNLAPAEGLFVADLQHSPMQPSGCPLCSLFAIAREPDSEGPFELCAFSSIISSLLINTAVKRKCEFWKYQNAFLAVVPKVPKHSSTGSAMSKYTGRGHALFRVLPTTTPVPPGIWAKELCGSPDYGAANGWLQFCAAYHRGLCTRPSLDTTQALPGFRLIDCESTPPTIQAASLSAKYAALSYVWGRTGITASWPKVVLDAITVTKRLGFRYLWVDRFCIDQENPQEKHFLISKMASIYRQAEITIVAAAGTDANCGLPGVGTTTRKSQPKLRLGSLTIASPLVGCRGEIRGSTWWTRGWTYQEGVLARRRLVFTKTQMFWECAGMVVWEAIHFPLEDVHIKRNLRMGMYMRPGVFSGAKGLRSFQSKGVSDSIRLEKSCRHIENFTGKRLSYDIDSLYAMAGILQFESDSSKALGFLHGLPITFQQKGQDTRQMSFGLFLTAWVHVDEPESVARLGHLPSWTWAGWKGRVSWDFGVARFWELQESLYSGTIDVYWAPKIFIGSTDGGDTREIGQTTRNELTGLDSKHLLRIPQPYAIVAHGITAEAHGNNWRFWTPKDALGELYLSSYDGVDVTGPKLTFSQEWNIALVLVAVERYDYARQGRRGLCRFLVVRPSARYGTPDCLERVGVALVHIPNTLEAQKWASMEEAISGLGMQLVPGYMYPDAKIC